MIEWFPERKMKSFSICVNRGKNLYFFGFIWKIISLLVALLPFFGIGTIGFGCIFSLCINVPLLCYYFWLLFKIKINDIGNGVPEKW